MAAQAIKSTYVMDIETMRALERTLDQLQRSLELSPARTRASARMARAERRAACIRAETR